jgi:hypothetical protein
VVDRTAIEEAEPEDRFRSAAVDPDIQVSAWAPATYSLAESAGVPSQAIRSQDPHQEFSKEKGANNDPDIRVSGSAHCCRQVSCSSQVNYTFCQRKKWLMVRQWRSRARAVDAAPPYPKRGQISLSQQFHVVRRLERKTQNYGS